MPRHAPIGTLALFLASRAVAGSDCCLPHGTPGCDDPDCQAMVCNLDPFCCNVQWDQLCADEAADVCDVCDPAVCGPGSGDCCHSNGTPGCENAAICTCVCGVDPFCCEVLWDNQCVQEGQQLCALFCGCDEVYPGMCWISIDGSPPGTPPTVAVEGPQVPDANSTVIEITVHGFYFEEVVEGGQTFHRVIVPDPDFADVEFDPITSPALPGEHELSRPELPYHSMFVGVVPIAPFMVESAEVLPPPGEVEPYFTITQYQGLPLKVYPAQPPTDDCDCCGDQPEFAFDPDFYLEHADFYPAGLTEPGVMQAEPVKTWMTVKVGRLQVNLAQFNPQAQVLRVARRVRVALGHAGIMPPPGPGRPDTSIDLDQVFNRIVNFDKIRGFFNQLVQVNYLIIVRSDSVNAIEPLRQMKMDQGLTVTRIVAGNAGDVPAPDIAPTQAAVQAAISNFYTNSRSLAVPYVLLVGDVDRIPAGGTVVKPVTGQSGVTDKPYALLTPDGIPDIPIARLCADNVSQIEGIVGKIVRYQTMPLAGAWLDKVLLAVHRLQKPLTPNTYLANQCGVKKMLAGLAAPPVIEYAPGRLLGADGAGNPDAGLCGPSAAAGNNFIETVLNEGIGVIGYRGHGCPDQWQSWSTLNNGPGGTSWTIADITANDVMNGCANPVVFAICCWNGQFHTATIPAGAAQPCGNAATNVADGIGERWMQIGGGQDAKLKGASAHYGAVLPSPTDINNRQNTDTFRSLYKGGTKRLGLLTMRVEAGLIEKFPQWAVPPPNVNAITRGELHAQMYNWQGDPHMAIRLSPPPAGADNACCPGDANGDGTVGVGDLVAVILAWGTPGNPLTDINGDGVVNVLDLVLVITNWGVC